MKPILFLIAAIFSLNLTAMDTNFRKIKNSPFILNVIEGKKLLLKFELIENLETSKVSFITRLYQQAENNELVLLKSYSNTYINEEELIAKLDNKFEKVYSEINTSSWSMAAKMAIVCGAYFGNVASLNPVVIALATLTCSTVSGLGNAYSEWSDQQEYLNLLSSSEQFLENKFLLQNPSNYNTDQFIELLDFIFN